MTPDLFADTPPDWREALAPGAVVLRGYALDAVPELLAAIADVQRQAPPQHMETPGGRTMSVATSSCGALGWVTDRSGYRYSGVDPYTGLPWPPMPAAIREMGCAAALDAGYPDFIPDTCLINRYQPGARMGLHQDRNERDFTAPIVSISLGLPTAFLFGGAQRGDRTQRIPLAHGDVVVWGGPSRLFFHGVAPLKPGQHPLTGEARYNLTLRRAG
ncbi:DNA oxidative demethylase AlkB [Chitinolyticbacter albus]|uniref:DNA oxidative demethylase AlkB n=1 Tax=Chitinolyticbacter albus TaxID=2961951 RepID=UPI00210C0FFE|nr:DNA oxidative demethylase AlkB [Chitinolyticbacter albus]